MDIGNYYLSNDKDGICKICVVVEKLKQRKINLTKTIRRKLFHEINFPFDIFIYEKEEFYFTDGCHVRMQHHVLIMYRFV